MTPNQLEIIPLSELQPPSPAHRVESLAVAPAELVDIARKWFSLDVANGDAQADTIRTYIYHFQHWLKWCAANGVNPGEVLEDDVMAYRRWLKEEKHLSSSTIQLKLVAMRRFYHSAHRNGLIKFNPVADVKAPPDRKAKDVIKNFTEQQVEQLAAAIPKGESLKAMRDRAMIALMFVEGVRRVSVSRANVEDMQLNSRGTRFLVRGKGRDYYINISSQTAEILNRYLMARGRIPADETGEPLIATVNKWGSTGQKRISRRSVSEATEVLLSAAAIKDEGKCCHALRHTCGHLIWVADQDLKKVQMQLGHTGLEMAAKYSHIENAAKAQISEKAIKVDLRE